MRVVAFIGSSGSGKSYRAIWVAKENNIDFIIDDGLLIKGNRIVAGHSAKKENTKLASVRRALFTQPNHVEQVKKALKAEKPSGILILGTSLNMVKAIVKALELPSLSTVIHIEDVAEQQEIDKAKEMRSVQGKHVIPVPTFEIKEDFSGYFIDPLRIFRRENKSAIPFIANKSIVRPTFSYMGGYTISDQVIYTICEYEALTIPSVTEVNRVWIQSKPTGIVANIELTLEYGIILRPEALKVQQKVKKALENYTGLNVLLINIKVKTLSLK